MKKYTAINIGPIIGTLSIARKPRELWSGSFLFSYLMESIISVLLKNNYEIISPAKNVSEEKSGVGVFPDRVFIKGEVDRILISDVVTEFGSKVGIKSIDRYLNIMTVTLETENEKEVIAKLNNLLNNLELNVVAQDESVRDNVLRLMKKRTDSPLFENAFGNKNFYVRSLPEIASYGLKLKNEEKWKEIVYKMKDKDDEDEDTFYADLKSAFGKDFKSFHKYVCIVQADGDSMGKVVSNIGLKDVGKLSGELMNFGVEACKLIKNYGGMPIYAGGDDLLFFAPVVSEVNGVATDIFKLLKSIDEKYGKVKKLVDDYNIECEKTKVTTSMSYGVSITYYKYPLYEAFEKARTLLFGVAKNVEGKNAIAWEIQKHSGSSFSAAYSKNNMALHDAFETLCTSIGVDSKLVSSLAHKLRAQKAVINQFYELEQATRKIRISNFLAKNMDLDCKNSDQANYIENAGNLLEELFEYLKKSFEDKEKEENENKEYSRDKSKIYSYDLMSYYIYNMLRSAKFINGEEDDHE